MVLTVDKLSSEPIYLQIRAQIIAAIARGELSPGDSLPSVRSLASDLGVNLHTVNKAYAVLQDEGYVAMMGRKGTLVTDPPSALSTDRFNVVKSKTYESLARLASEYLACGGTRESFIELADQAASSKEG